MRHILGAVAVLVGLAGAGLGADANVLVIDAAEMAGISGFRADWDRSVVLAGDGATRMSDKGQHGKGLVADWSTGAPGAAVFDAVHRSLLLRFPGSAEAVAAALKDGKDIERVEIEFEFIDTEFFPMGYRDPAGMSFMGNLWVRKPPRWHAVAWALRQPWKADPAVGPTFNASVNGKRYWNHFGAQDEQADRFPGAFGPTEVSFQALTNRMDVTACFTNGSFGATIEQRLRTFADCGILVRKWETYDALYNHGGYEYGGAPGHRGIRVGAPRLIVTLGQGKTGVKILPAAADIAALPAAGAPTAVMPSEEQVREWIER